MDTTLDRLADFIAATRFAQLPEPLVAQAKRHLMDTLGAALAVGGLTGLVSLIA